MARERGFSLIEVVITVALAGILLAVALPAYTSHLLRSRRSDAANALAQVQIAQERWRGNNAAYAPSLTSLGLQSTSPQGHYNVSITASSASGYSAVATASSSQQQADEHCRNLSVTLAGGNLTYGSSDAAGVADTSGANRCWAR